MPDDTALLLEHHFDTAFAAPDGIQKLRELILTLAMQGKLVPQDPNDQPASELLKAIEAEKVRLVREGKIKQPKPLPEIKMEEVPYELPREWTWVRLGEIGEINPRNICDDDSKAGFVPMPLIFAKYGSVHKFEPRKWAEIKKGFTHFADGDVALAKITPCFENGKSCVFDGLPNGIGAGTTELHIFRNTFNAVYPEYLLAYFKDPKYIASGTSKMTGSAGQKRVPTDFFKLNPFPLPPLAEQRRIVAKIDQLMARCDELEKLRSDRAQKLITVHTAALDRLLTAQDSDDFSTAWRFITQHFGELYSVKETVAELRKTILQLAVMGKLVPQESAPQTASLQSILAEASINGVSKGPTSDTSATEILRISAGTSQRDFYVNEDDFKHVDLSANEIQKFQLVPGDLLACRFNGNLHYVGRFSYYRGESGRVQVNPDKLIRFRIDTGLCCPRYVCYMMNASQTREAIEAMCATTAGNIGLSAGRLKTIKIPLPPLVEQHRIVAKVDQLMALCDQLEGAISAAQAKQSDLLNAVMAQV